MSEDITRLRRAALREYSGEVSPEYERISSLLLGRLAAHGATAEQLAQQEVNDRRNVALLSIFTELLPKVPLRDHRWDFRTKDPSHVRALLSYAVWREQVSGGVKLNPNRQSSPDSHNIGYPGKEEEEQVAQEAARVRFSYRPYVVLGAYGKGRRSKWLLGCIGADAASRKGDTLVRKSYGKIFFMEPSFGSRGKLDGLRAMAASEFPSPEEARQHFDLDEHCFVVNGTSVGSTQAKHKYMTALPSPARISDVEWGQFDVDSYLQRIATTYGLEQQLDDLYVAQPHLELPQ